MITFQRLKYFCITLICGTVLATAVASAGDKQELSNQVIQFSPLQQAYFQPADEEICRLKLYFAKKGIKQLVDCYEEEGGEPELANVFIINLKQQPTLVVVIKWQQLHRLERINGYLYQIYAYTYQNEQLQVNPLINQDLNLQGDDGEFGGEEFHFIYKDHNALQQYLLAHYNK